ncbi:MAG TPA: serine hydrolase [Bacteroidia bacterium]|nr:serine hydrolase [Bacteroidia bacterium]
MKKIKSIFLFTCITIFVNAQNSFQPFVDSLAKTYLEEYSGALVIGIHDNGKEKIFYYGNNQKPDSNSIFELGGITETFTSVLLADMSVKGDVKMDEKLQDFLPVTVPAPVYQKIICEKAADPSQDRQKGEHDNLRINFTPFVCFPDPSSKPQFIILCDLATHTTGLPEYPYNLKNYKNVPFANYKKEDLYDFIKEYRFDKPLGYDYKHSYVGVAFLGHALALKTKTEFDTLITERIFTSLQMSDTRIHLSQKQQKRLLSGYDRYGNKIPNWNYDVLAPAGGMHSTINDMMKFLRANISSKKDSLSNILDYTHNARLKLGGKRKDTEISLGWKINSLGADEKRVVWQEGSTGGFSSYIGFVETNHTGVVILSSVSKNVNSISVEILKKLAREKLQQ